MNHTDTHPCEQCGRPIDRIYRLCYQCHERERAKNLNVTHTFNPEDRELWRQVQQHRLRKY